MDPQARRFMWSVIA
jgi:ATP-binding cassette, subfamily A (ABC1), member 3